MTHDRKLSAPSEAVFIDAMRLLHQAYDEDDPIQRRRLMTDAVLAALAHGDARAKQRIDDLEAEVTLLRAKIETLSRELSDVRAVNRRLRGGR